MTARPRTVVKTACHRHTGQDQVPRGSYLQSSALGPWQAAVPLGFQHRGRLPTTPPTNAEFKVEPTVTFTNLFGSPRIVDEQGTTTREPSETEFELILSLGLPTRASWLEFTVEGDLLSRSIVGERAGAGVRHQLHWQSGSASMLRLLRLSMRPDGRIVRTELARRSCSAPSN